MITLLWRLFGRGKTGQEGRSLLSVLCGAAGIFLNLLMTAGKYLVGTLSGSVAITADAFNNLTDVLSSIVSIIGTRLAGQKPDPEHPFGHGRLEYVAGLLIEMLILHTGLDLLRESIDAVREPMPVQASPLAAAVLLGSIGIKLYMYAYNRAVGNRIQSDPVKACAIDSLNDTLATFIALVGMGASRFVAFPLDGICGIVVSLFILKGGWDALMGTVSELMGKAPEQELTEQIEQIVLEHEHIIGVHDLVVHDYGMGRRMISLHAEVPADGDILLLHDEVDNAERELFERMNCITTIHMDPVSRDEATEKERLIVEQIVSAYDPALSMHDFRMVSGPTHTNVIFDIVAPFGYAVSDRELSAEIGRRIRENNPAYFAVIQVDHRYTG